MRGTEIDLLTSIKRLCRSPVFWFAFVLVATGLLLGVAMHNGFLTLMVLGAFGPSVLRQFGLGYGQSLRGILDI